MSSTNSLTLDQTASWAQEFVQQLKPGDRVLFEGTLGAGKTTLIGSCLDALAKRFGLEAEFDFQGSPTFPIVHEYTFSRDPSIHWIHTDWYRIKSEMELEEIGMAEVLSNAQTILFGEWFSLYEDWAASALKSSSGQVIRVRLELGEDEKTRLISLI